MSRGATAGGSIVAAWSARAPQRAFAAVATGLFIGSVTVTIACAASMSSMDAMPMPGGWSMSMAWMRGPGQTWADVALSFLGMWTVMMTAMMLPALMPMLLRYRRVVGGGGNGPRLGRLSALVGAGYFCIWIAFGAAAFALGVPLAALAMQHPALARAAPMLTGAAVVLAGLCQFTAWKMRWLACCRAAAVPGPVRAENARSAWRHGLHLGLHCCYCCANLTVILLVLGVMDLAVMANVAAGITAERFLPGGKRVAHCVGSVAVAAGLFLIARTSGPG